MVLVTDAGTITSEENFRAMNPMVSFPAMLSPADIAPYGMSILQLTPSPTLSPYYSVSQGVPVLVDGVWTQTWIQTPIGLAAAQALQVGILTTMCGAGIVGGFMSSALGTPYTYPSTLVDQQNLAASVLASVLPNLPANWTTKFWCEDTSGKWARIPHTAAQIQQAGLDSKVFVEAYQDQNDLLSAQVMAATTIAEIQAVVWVPPTI